MRYFFFLAHQYLCTYIYKIQFNGKEEKRTELFFFHGIKPELIINQVLFCECLSGAFKVASYNKKVIIGNL